VAADVAQQSVSSLEATQMFTHNDTLQQNLNEMELFQSHT